jgi:hypothetical protein
VPRDRTKPDGKTIKVYFERYPRRHRELRKISTVVSIEGGPGYPVTPGRSTRVELWHPVSGKRDLVLIDLRGTGRSAPLGCEAFSRKSRGYVARAGRCAAQIGPERDLYSTSQAVQDMEAVLRSLHAGKIDLTATPTGRMPCRPTPCASRSDSGPSSSAPPTPCRAPTPPGPTSPKRSAEASSFPARGRWGARRRIR